MTRISSRFGEQSNAAEVAEGHDLAGKRAIVTGASAGIGVETARVLAAHGAEVVLAVRDPVAVAALVEEIEAAGGRAYASALDLADFRSVEAFAAREGDRPLHLLINNAGVMACPLGRTTQGFETQLGVNHIGHFLLTKLLLPALEAANGARVVSVSSTGHHWGAFDFDDPNYERTEYNAVSAYGRAKSANALFAVELDRRYRDKGIRAFSLMPGAIPTSLGRYLTEDVRGEIGATMEGKANPIWKTIPQGAATTVWAALAPELDGQGGLYLEDCEEAVPAAPGVNRGVQPWAIDPDAARKLWDWSEAAIANAKQKEEMA
ncbi:MAG: SDR family NAD(P)-dependent oxidoreductase [Sphingomonadaceae bacterium]|nr:SDR family NAD(P)-dependent oxidoreductase [Sphingomonadaceae bacterium]